jgi:hypothetical protein
MLKKSDCSSFERFSRNDDSSGLVALNHCCANPVRRSRIFRAFLPAGVFQHNRPKPEAGDLPTELPLSASIPDLRLSPIKRRGSADSGRSSGRGQVATIDSERPFVVCAGALFYLKPKSYFRAETAIGAHAKFSG